MLIRLFTLMLMMFPLCLCLAAPVAEAAPVLQYRHAGDSDPTDPANAPGEVWSIEPGAFATPGVLNAGVAQIEIGPLSPDSNCSGCGIAAWGVDDRSTAGGSRYRYLQVPTPAQIADAATEGWTLRAELRIASDEDSQPRAIDPADAIGIEYNEGPGLDRFLAVFGADDEGDPIIQLGTGESYTSQGVGNTAYVLYEIVWRPDLQRIHVLVDGVEQISDAVPLDGSTINPRLHFGSGSSSGQGRAHFALVEWETGLPDGTLGNECDNGLDDDGDGFYDIDDPSCLGGTVGVEQLGTACDNGIDDDGDGWTDLVDPSCLNDLTATTEQLGTLCDNGIDDDGDGMIDMRDAGCGFDPNGASEGGEFIVDSTADASDANPGDGVCATAAAECTLRAAIEETNDLPGTQGVRLPAGIYALSEGQITIGGGLALIAPSGSDDTIIDAGGNSRVLEVVNSVVVTILGATVQGGDSPSLAGGLSASSSGVDLRILESAFLGNRSVASGGGIRMTSNAKLLMVDSLVSGNETTSSSSGAGGGVYLIGANGSGTFVRTSVIGNTSAASGGGIYLIQGELVLRDSLIQENGNLSGSGSGLLCAGTCRLIRSSIEGNIGRGAAVSLNAGIAVITNSTVSSNSSLSAASSAGIGIFSGTGQPAVRLDNVTVIGNALSSGPGGHQISGAQIVTNSIITSGGAGVGSCSPFGSPIESRGGNLSDDATCFSADPVMGDQVVADPMLTRLSNGVAYYPIPGSPVLDAGIGGACAPFDQLGSARPVDGDLSGAAECDTGAVEYLPEPGMGIGLLLGTAGLVGVGRRRRSGGTGSIRDRSA